MNDRHCRAKRNFTSEQFALDFVGWHVKKYKKFKKLYPYKCHECRYWHLTSRKR